MSTPALPSPAAPVTKLTSEEFLARYSSLPVTEGLLPQAPDLVVEVKSPKDRWGDLFAKVGESLNAGCWS